MWLTASPSNSRVTCWAEQGMFSPDDVLKTRQSGRKSIMLLLQFFDFLYEIGRFIEAPIKTGITHIGHRIESAQSIHDALADSSVRDFTVVGIGKIVGDRIDQHLEGLLADRTLLTGLLDAREQFHARKLFAAIIALENHQTPALDLLVGRVTVLAAETLPASSNPGALTRGP